MILSLILKILKSSIYRNNLLKINLGSDDLLRYHFANHTFDLAVKKSVYESSELLKI